MKLVNTLHLKILCYKNMEMQALSYTDGGTIDWTNLHGDQFSRTYPPIQPFYL